MRNIIIFNLLALWALASSFDGRVVKVTDGDTITVLTEGNRQVKVRLAQIDAPEKAMAYGRKSKESLAEMVAGKHVTIEEETKDRYGRSVGRVLLGGEDVNLEQVKRGMAWVYRQYAHDTDYFRAEETAMGARIGLWTDTDPTPPWEWRRAQRSGGGAVHTNAPKECGTKRYCKEMTSCDEARFYLEVCGRESLDRDKDGIPCESLCR